MWCRQMAEGSGGNTTLEITTAGANQEPHTARASEVPHKDKDVVVEDYELKLRSVKAAALFTVTLYSVNRFVGFCTLTWATVVILGAFVQELPKIDFSFVSVLLLLEAIRLAVATFFSNIVTRSLTNQRQYPDKLRYGDSARQTIVAFFRIVGPLCLCIITSTTVILPTLRLRSVGKLDNGKHSYGLRWSLFIFYSLVLLNAIVAVLAALCSVFVTPWFVTSYSLYGYYDEVVWSGMSKGLLSASTFSFTFAFKLQSEMYRRRERATTVRNLYDDLLEYLFCHNKGFAAALIALDSTDNYEQEAAANIVGLWTKWDVRQRRILGLQRRLLSKLAEMVDNEETGRSVTSSFQQLAKYDPKSVLLVQSESREKLVDILFNSIDTLVKASKYDRSLVCVKALIPLLEDSYCLEKLRTCNRQQLDGLKKNLETIFKSDKCFKRSKAIAGHALREMDESKPTKDEITRFLRDPGLRPKEYILDDEHEYAKDLLDNSLPKPAWFHKLEVKKPEEPIKFEHNYVRNCLIASVAIVLLACAFLAALLLSPQGS